MILPAVLQINNLNESLGSASEVYQGAPRGQRLSQWCVLHPAGHKGVVDQDRPKRNEENTPVLSPVLIQ